MCQCCVRDNHVSVNFPTQPFLLLSCLCRFKAFSGSTFLIFYETHTPANDNKIVLENIVASSSLFLHNCRTEIIGIRP